MTIQEYERIEALRVSEIVKYAVKDIDTIIKESKQERTMTESIIIGLATHSILLRKDRSGIPDDIRVIDYENYRTKEAQKQKTEALENGLIPLLINQYDNIMRGLDFSRKELDLFFNPSECEFEKALFATDEFFGKIKGRLDCIQNNTSVNDLKVTTQTNMLDKKIFDFGYQLQMYIYMQLAGLTEANLVFYNPETYIVYVKKIDIHQIQDECVSLLQRAKDNLNRFKVYESGEMGVIDCGDYITPQWAYNYLMENV